jgi:hypothetical protein
MWEIGNYRKEHLQRIFMEFDAADDAWLGHSYIPSRIWHVAYGI